MQTYFVVFALVCSYTLLIMADVEGPIPYQSTCDPSTNSADNGACSTSSYCRCASAATGEPICTQQMNCDYAALCGVNDTCVKDGSTCVIDNRCPGKRLCYSITIFSPELCPPLSTESDGSN